MAVNLPRIGGLPKEREPPARQPPGRGTPGARSLQIRE